VIEKDEKDEEDEKRLKERDEREKEEDGRTKQSGRDLPTKLSKSRRRSYLNDSEAALVG
jgi:hypothetical protein